MPLMGGAVAGGLTAFSAEREIIVRESWEVTAVVAARYVGGYSVYIFLVQGLVAQHMYIYYR